MRVGWVRWRWEDLTRNNEGRGVGAEVEEQLGDDDEGEASTGAEGVIRTSEDTEHESSDEETLDLNPLPAEQFNEGDGEEVARNVTSDGDDQVTLGVPEEVVVWVGASGETDISKNDGLVQIDAVEGNVDQEP